ncbi:TonB-dependent receptor [Shewanella fidelis]|uniref:TonB-dependent receptor n=1 Tax=Shewanella fidelis TaxID=173509 RepID=A0AAW8NLR8_9GAMM|nr:TonB-dependent receptor [Shewanella fidelis]MDR8522709.1 TonB-dependent receptor [Shewanella fidelis]MDW4812324.1 TonB-dependent receptor [Shewanella fidelis]MDW4816011.1 TonB-dependent receptor [Shewanella fidelis]MDW4820565.1 TonB-dependent receptor [Shewanella fidelis]MDW4824788.1 TonB-dependent receptor [Shewanella fidelis]
MAPYLSGKKLHPLVVSLSLALWAGNAYAADTDDSTTHFDDIESVVVVGQTTNTEITPEELEKYQANDLADIFRFVPSVSVGGSLGIAQKVYIRGLEDTLFNVTVDGAPQTGTLFHHIGRVAIEPELLKEVEVQAGAGEATSGAGAIGGAIRFKTKNIDDLLDSDERFGGSLKAGYFSNDGYKGSGTFYGRLTDSWGLLGSYVYVDRNNMEDGDGNELYGTSAKQKLGFVKLNGELTNNQNLTMSYENRNEQGEFGARPNWPTLEGDTLYPMDAERETFVVNHQWLANDYVNLETTLYHTQSSVEQDRFDRWGKYGADMTTYGFDIRNLSQLGQHALTYGIEYRKDEVSSQYLAPDDVWQGWAWDPLVGKFKEEGEVKGIYIQDHWQVANQLLLSFGLRYDEYSLEQVTYADATDSDGVSGNIGLNYDLHENWRLTAGYAQAMRGKEVGDAFTLEQAPGWTSIDPDLKAEEVDNTEVGLTYHNEYWQITATVYQSDIDNVIYDQLGRGVYFENIGTLETKGFELRGIFAYEDWRVQASYSNNDAELNGQTVEGYEHIGLANARGDTFGLNINYTLTDNIQMGWNANYVSSLNDIEVLQRGVEIGWIDQTQFIDKPSYQVHDIYVQWLPFYDETLNINLAVQNLFDEQYRDHSSVGDYSHIAGWEGVAGLYEAGRDIRISLGYQF